MNPAVDENETLINTAQVKAMFGGVSDMWVDRKLKLKDPALAFPQPDAFISNRRYWKLGRVRAWRDAQGKGTTRGPAASAVAVVLALLQVWPSWTPAVTPSCDPDPCLCMDVTAAQEFLRVRAPAYRTAAREIW
jgi:hypothetical protein